MWKSESKNPRQVKTKDKHLAQEKWIVIIYTDEVYNYLLIITYCLHFPICIYRIFTPVASLPFPTEGYINNRGQTKNLHFPDAFLAK